MIGGIEQLISERMDANRNNPEALMQSYSQNQQLIDLLALQKLKSEKEAAARQMQMQMQQQPQTIAQQREAELLGMTRDEVAQNAGGAYQQQDRQRQQMMEKIANSGIGSISGAMPRMAGGGIVSFAPGGDVGKRQKIQEALQQGSTIRDLEAIFRNDPEAMAILQEISPAAESADIPYGAEFDTEGRDSVFSKAGRIARTLSGVTPLAGYKKLWEMAGEYGPNLEEALAAFSAGASGETPPRIPGMFERRPQEEPARAAPEEDVLEKIAPQGERMETPPPRDSGGITSVLPTAPADTLSSALEESLIGGLSRDAASEGREATREDEEYLNVKELQDRLQPYLEKMRAMERSPQEKARERLIASLTNMAGRSTPGMTFAAGARGGLNALARQRAEERKNLADQMAIDEGIGKLALGAREKALEGGRAVRGDVEEAIRQAQASASNVIMARAQKSISDDAKLMNAFASTGANMAEILDAATKRLAEDPEYANIAQLIDAARNDPEKLATLRAAQEEIKNRVMAPFLREIDSLRSLQQSIGGRLGLPPLSTGGESSGLQVNPDDFTVE